SVAAEDVVLAEDVRQEDPAEPTLLERPREIRPVVQAVVGAAAVIGVAPQSGGLEGGHEHLEGVEQDRGGHRVSSKWSTVRGSRAGSSAASAAARESPHRAVR